MDRREFLKKSFLIGGAVGASILFDKNISTGKLFAADNDSSSMPDLVAIKGGEPDIMFDQGIKAYGGMNTFIKKGYKVVIKPNISWNRTPEFGANTNPKLVARIIEHCLNAGAKKVYVFDHTCDQWEYCYKNSGIENSAKNAGAQVVPANKENYYQNVNIPNGKVLKITKVHELILDCDVFINVPILKHHAASQLTIAMKNLMGAMWDRGFYHSFGLQQSIADFCLFKKPTLNIVDAYIIMVANGPRGNSVNDTRIIKNQLISTDIVAIDAAAAKIYGINPEDVGYIKIADGLKIGKMDLSSLNIKKIVI